MKAAEGATYDAADLFWRHGDLDLGEDEYHGDDVDVVIEGRAWCRCDGYAEQVLATNERNSLSTES